MNFDIIIVRWQKDTQIMCLEKLVTGKSINLSELHIRPIVVILLISYQKIQIQMINVQRMFKIGCKQHALTFMANV